MENSNQKEYIFGGIFALANRVQILGDKIDENMTIKQWLFLAIVSICESKAPTISEISNMMGSSRQNVKKMALILEKRKFAIVKKDEYDSRVIRVTLTEQCEQYFKSIEERSVDFIEKIFKGFDKEMITGLYEGFVKLEGNVAEMEKNYENEKKKEN